VNGTVENGTVGPVTPGPDSRPSLGEVLSDVTQDISTLMRQEVELAKAEIRQSATKAGKGAGMLGGAGISGYMVVLFVSIAAWWGLGDTTGHGWSALIVAAAWLIVAAALALAGRNEIKSVSGLPRTAESVKKIPDAVKGNEEMA
jgi:Putative Actinobacterial Holin-X, holin superfamily III